MIQFSETQATAGTRRFTLTDDGKQAGTGELRLNNGRIDIRLSASAAPKRDFLFRSLLNVCKDLGGLSAAVAPDTVALLGGEAYIGKFGFTKEANGAYTVPCTEIRFDTCT